VDEFERNNIQITVYSDKNISATQAKNLWANKVASIFVDDPSGYFK
jgi:hypothetical protein